MEISQTTILSKIASFMINCNNLWIKHSDGKITKNAVKDILINLDELPFYDWDIYSDFHYYRIYDGEVNKMGDYSTSRGCINNCSYCFNKLLRKSYGMKHSLIRRYSVERIIDELVYLKEKYNITFIKFHDSDFLNKSNSYFDKFSSLYQKYVNLPNTVNGCVELLI